jgi:hypothetical protein
MPEDEELEDEELEDEEVDLDDVDADDYEGDFEPSELDDELLEKAPENAVKANPKRVSAAQRKKNKKLVEGIIDSTYFESPESAVKAFDKLKEETNLDAAKKYSLDVELTENDTVRHPKFGVGFVLELISPTKVEVLFEDGELVKLVCNQASKGA